MKKKQIISIITFIFLILIMPKNVSAKENITCTYQYNDKELIYKIATDKVELPFSDGENNWYHQSDFANIFYSQATQNSINYVCPTITIEESTSFITLFNNPKKEEDCDGICKELVATNTTSNKNITVKKAVETTAISSVGIYNDTKYFIPYFRLLNDGTKEWSVNGYEFIGLNDTYIIEPSKNVQVTIKLDETLVKEIFKNGEINATNIYRNVKEVSPNKYEYLLATKKISSYDLNDNQELASSYATGAFGANASKTSNNWQMGAVQTLSCGGDSVLGSVNDPNSVAWLLDKIFGYIKVIGPFLVIILSGIDYCKIIITGDDDARKKSNSRLATRLILIVLLFLLPDLIMVIMNMIGMTSNATCGIN